MKRLRNIISISLLSLGVAMLFSACQGGHEEHDGAAGHDQETHAGEAHHHHHEPPHGGTGVTLGDEDFHLEFLRDATAGKMTLWVLAPHMTGYVRIPAETLEMTAKVDGAEKKLTFHAQASPETGETVGDTSMFVAEADWLKGKETFDAVLKEITIKGNVYPAVSFNFPKGN